MKALFACDEGRFGLKTWLRRRWCPRGSRPPWIVDDRYEWLWGYVAVEPATGRLCCLLLPSMQASSLELFLQQMREQFPDERIGIVWDNAPSHRSHQLEWPADMVPMALPAYSPELNPAKQLFRLLRRRLANRIFETLDELQEALVAELEQLWTHPDGLIQLTGYPWWLQALPFI